MFDEKENEQEKLIINEVQLILAEKRTSLAALRTGIAVFALPLSVLSVLIATSKYYDFMQVIHMIVPLLILCMALGFLGAYLVTRSVIKIHRYDKSILEIKNTHAKVGKFID